MRPASPTENAIFERLCGAATQAEVVALRRQIVAHLEDFRQAARAQELLPVDLAEELARRLDELLLAYASLSPDAQRLVVGAARYFCSEKDAIPDTSSVLGLDDDVAVFNAVARRIGRQDLELDG